jgi:hypothetical protein
MNVYRLELRRPLIDRDAGPQDEAMTAEPAQTWRSALRSGKSASRATQAAIREDRAG